MLIDCDTCVVRGPACGDCVVTVLLGFPAFGRPGAEDGPGVPEGVEVGGSVTAAEALDLDQAEQAAIAVLAGSGLVPPLRLVPGEAGRAPGTTVGHPAAEAG
jgi:hypothetical protein